MESILTNQILLATQKHPEEHEEIAELAYQYWQERGSPVGSPETDWFRAEEVVRRRAEAATRL